MAIPAGFERIKNSERLPARGATHLGPANPAETISVSVLVRRNPKTSVLPNVAKKSIGSRQHFSRKEFAAKFGAAQAELNLVIKFARAHGLIVVESSAPRRTVVLSGTVAQMNAAFAVDLQQYQLEADSFHSHHGGANVPSDLAGVIEGVFGLDNRKLLKPMIKSAEALLPVDIVEYLTPQQVASLYKFPTSLTGSGQAIGIVEFSGGFYANDLQTFFTNYGLGTAPQVVVVGIDGATNSPGNYSFDKEVALDMQVAAAVAPGATLVMYFTPPNEQGFVDFLTTALADSVNNPSSLSISWGLPEDEFSSSSISSMSSLFCDLARVGVSVFAASGDSGSGSPPNAFVNYPASDPWVTGCGGTTTYNVQGTSFSQKVWNELGSLSGGVTGGGVSKIFPLPAYQIGAGVGTSANPGGGEGRGVPDVAGNADLDSGYMLVINGKWDGSHGGTSAVPPLYSGLVALINSVLGRRVGFLNTSLYANKGTPLHPTPSVPFIDIPFSQGNNGAYYAQDGWDACTGLGTIIGNVLLSLLEGPFLWVTAQEGGTIVAPFTQPVGLSSNTSLTITALPNEGCAFASWNVVRGTATIADPHAQTTTVTITSDASEVFIQANFSCTLTLRVFPTNYGTVTPATPTTVPSGAPIPISATPHKNCTFAGWTTASGAVTIAETGMQNTSATPTSDATVTANFWRDGPQ